MALGGTAFGVLEEVVGPERANELPRRLLMTRLVVAETLLASYA